MNRTTAGRRGDVRTVTRAQLRAKSQLTMPVEVREALHIDEGDEVEFQISEDGTVSVRGLATIDADQRWFWTREWQKGEHAASAEIATGGLTVHDNADDMFDALER